MPRAEVEALPQAARTWARIGFLSFGGPAGQIALMHRLLVDEKRWISDDRFLHALKFCTLLPGPEAQQLATYIGWLLHGIRGGLIAGTLFVLPGVVVLLGLSWLYHRFGSVPAVSGLFVGLKAAVLAIVLQALVRLSRRALPTRGLTLVAMLAFLALAVFQVPFPLVVLGAGLVGWFTFRPDRLRDAPSERPPSRPPRTFAVLLVGLALWLGPIVVLAATLGPEHRFTAMAMFFSRAAVVTFGGAYAVLSYAAQEVVGEFGWIEPPEMIDGLALAETTPGPLILVLQFIGFLAGSRAGPPIDGVAGGLVGSALAVWTTFVPSILFVLLGAPYMERLRQWRGLDGALTAVTAAVLGVIANLTLWFGLHTLFRERRDLAVLGRALEVPLISSLDLVALTLTVAALLAALRFERGMFEVLAGSAVAGLGAQLLGLVGA